MNQMDIPEVKIIITENLKTHYMGYSSPSIQNI